MNYIRRHMETQILEASKYYPVIMVCGQRQVGKSTMLNHLREEGTGMSRWMMHMQGLWRNGIRFFSLKHTDLRF